MALYDYGNTRLRARISNFFSLPTLESYSDLTSIDALISNLSKTHYKTSIEIALTYAHGYGCITEALRRETIDIRQNLMRFYAPDIWEKIKILFERVDLQNMKSIFRGICHEARIDTIINSLSPLGTIDERFLFRLAKSKNAAEAIDRIAIFGLDIAGELLEKKSSDKKCTSSEIERTLENWYFRKMSAALKRNEENTILMRKLVSIETDIINLNLLLRFVDAPTSPDKEDHSIEYFIIDGGNFRRNQLIQLSKESSVEKVITRLAPTHYHDYLMEALSCYRENGLLSEFENKIRIYALKWLALLPKLNPFGIGVPMGYVALKNSEIRNIRWIAKGIYSGFEAGFIKENIEKAA
jgi:V/A-type H+/Na+-transporting ATPase subunit C